MPQEIDTGDSVAKKKEEFSPFIFWPMTGLWVLVAVNSGPIIFIVSMMMFDAPGSEDNPITHLLSLFFVAIPMAAFLAPFFAYPFKKKGQTKKIMAIFFGLPAIPAGALIILMLILNIFCDGQFACS